MRRSVYIFILILLVLNSFGQVMQPKLRLYYNLKNAGDDYLYHLKDTTKALLFYDSAFNYFVANFDSTFCELHQDLIKFHGTQGNSKKVYEYIKYGIMVNHINDKPEYYTPTTQRNLEEYNVFRNSEYWKLFVKDYDSLYRVAVSGLNWELLSEYLAIAKIDQIARQAELSKTKQLCIDSGYEYDKIAKVLMNDFDKINLLKVVNLIKENGFLNYSETGGKIAIYNNVLIHSFSSCLKDSSLMWTYKFIDSLLLNNVFLGRYPSSFYAFFKDRSYSYHCKGPQKYGTWSGGSKVIFNGLQDVENVDKLRYEIGLPPLYIQSLMDGFKLPEGYKIPEKYK